MSRQERIRNNRRGEEMRGYKEERKLGVGENVSGHERRK